MEACSIKSSDSIDTLRIIYNEDKQLPLLYNYSFGWSWSPAMNNRTPQRRKLFHHPFLWLASAAISPALSSAPLPLVDYAHSQHMNSSTSSAHESLSGWTWVEETDQNDITWLRALSEISSPEPGPNNGVDHMMETQMAVSCNETLAVITLDVSQDDFELVPVAGLSDNMSVALFHFLGGDFPSEPHDDWFAIGASTISSIPGAIVLDPSRTDDLLEQMLAARFFFQAVHFNGQENPSIYMRSVEGANLVVPIILEACKAGMTFEGVLR